MGDWVFLHLQPHKQHSVASWIPQKLAPRFFGPYKIVARVGTVAYTLCLPPSSKIHPTFHVSRLKHAFGQY